MTYILKIKIIQTQIKLTLPYPYKGQFYEDTVDGTVTLGHNRQVSYIMTQ